MIFLFILATNFKMNRIIFLLISFAFVANESYSQISATPKGVQTSPYLWADEEFEWVGKIYDIKRFGLDYAEFGTKKYQCNNIITLFFLPDGKDKQYYGFPQNGLPFGAAYNGDTSGLNKNDKVRIKAKVLSQIRGGTVILEVLKIQKI